MTIRWDRIGGGMAIGALSAAALIGAYEFGIHVAPTLPSSDSGLVNEDSTPWCTDPIADAGGICHGEPLPACATEDSTDCYWDAARMGNGQGRSFVDVDGVVYYQDMAR